MAASADIVARVVATSSDVAAHRDAAEVDIIARSQPPGADVLAYPSPRGPWPQPEAAASGDVVTPASATASFAADAPTVAAGAVAVTPASAAGAFAADAPTAIPGALSVSPASATAAYAADTPTATPGTATAAPASASAAYAADAPTVTAGAVAATPASAAAAWSADAPDAVPGAVSALPGSATGEFAADAPSASTTAPAPNPATPTVVAIPVFASSSGGGGGSIGVGWGGFDWLKKSRSSTGPTAREGAALLSALRQAGNRMDARIGADSLLGHWRSVRGELKPEGRVRMGRGARSAYRAARRARGGTMAHAQPAPSIFERVMNAPAPRGLAGFGYLAAVPPSPAGIDNACVTPSTKTAGAFVRGESGAGVAFALATLGRAVLIAPGLYIAGVRGPMLVKASLGAAGAISLYILLYLRSTGCGR